MTEEQSKINKVICKVVYKAKPLTDFISKRFSIFLFIIGISYFMLSIYILYHPLPPVPIAAFDILGLNNNMTPAIIGFISSIICIMAPIIEFYKPIKTTMCKFFDTVGYGILVPSIIIMFFVLCIIDVIYGILFGSIGFISIVGILNKIIDITESCPKLNNKEGV